MSDDAELIARLRERAAKLRKGVAQCNEEMGEQLGQPNFIEDDGIERFEPCWFCITAILHAQVQEDAADALEQRTRTIKRLNRRCQIAEAAANLKVEQWGQRSKGQGRAYMWDSARQYFEPQIAAADQRARTVEAETWDQAHQAVAALEPFGPMLMLSGVQSALRAAQQAGKGREPCMRTTGSAS
jgi:LPS O-antigen subunit length determinant protein (WzzB/FepE family)